MVSGFKQSKALEIKSFAAFLPFSTRLRILYNFFLCDLLIFFKIGPAFETPNEGSQ